MVGGPLFEIVLVLFFVFLAMSALVSFVQDLALKAMQWKSRTLRRGIAHMLEDDGAYKTEIAQRFYRHPMIVSLNGSKTGITSIQAETFTAALATAILPKGVMKDPIAAMPESIAALQEGSLKQRLSLVLPPEGDREHIKDAVRIWFDSSMGKIGERYKADCVAFSYIVAALATVILNVSPIEIGQRLMANDALRTTFASVVPELTNTLFSQGNGPAVAMPGPAPQGTRLLAGETTADGADAPQTAATLMGAPETANQPLTDLDVQTMWAVYQCSKGKLDLPIGWPWMAESMNSMRQGVGGFTEMPTEKAACNAATRSATGEGSALVSRLGKLNEVGIQQNSRPLYGPNFATDDPLLILTGWLIMVIAAAQGAPFWFNALRMVMRR